MNIRPAVITAVTLAAIGVERIGYLHHTHVMLTSPKWSAM